MSDPTTTPDGAPAPRPNEPNRRRRPNPRDRRFPLRHSGAGFGFRRRVGSGPWAARALALLVTLAIVGPIAFAGTGGAAASGVAGVPTLQGYFIVGNGAALVAVGFLGWADVWTNAPNGSDVFSSAFYLAFFNLHTYTVVVPINLWEHGYWVYNGTVTIAPLTQNTVSIPLPAITSWSRASLYFFGVNYWSGRVATPISLLPNYILNIGGLDDFSMAIVSFSLIFITVGVTIGRWAMRRAVFAPKFTALIWFHVILGCILAFVIVDFQFVDATFAGLSPLLYPLVLGPMAFLWSLSLFNRAPKVQVQQAMLTGNEEMGFLLTELRVGRLPNGKLVPIDESIGGFWARFFHHNAPPFDSGDPTKPKAWLAPIAYGVSPTATLRERMKAKRRAVPMATAGAEEILKFPVVNASTGKDSPSFIAFGKGTEAPAIDFPFLTVHKWVTLPPRYAANPLGGPPIVVRPERQVWRLTWPHYVDPDPSKPPELEDYHYQTGQAVFAKYAAARDLGRLYSKICHAFAILTANVNNRVDDEVYSQLRTHYSLTGRVSSGISEDEAARRSGLLTNLLEAQKKESP